MSSEMFPPILDNLLGSLQFIRKTCKTYNNIFISLIKYYKRLKQFHHYGLEETLKQLNNIYQKKRKNLIHHKKLFNYSKCKIKKNQISILTKIMKRNQKSLNQLKTIQQLYKLLRKAKNLKNMLITSTIIQVKRIIENYRGNIESFSSGEVNIQIPQLANERVSLQQVVLSKIYMQSELYPQPESLSKQIENVIVQQLQQNQLNLSSDIIRLMMVNEILTVDLKESNKQNINEEMKLQTKNRLEGLINLPKFKGSAIFNCVVNPKFSRYLENYFQEVFVTKQNKKPLDKIRNLNDWANTIISSKYYYYQGFFQVDHLAVQNSQQIPFLDQYLMNRSDLMLNTRQEYQDDSLQRVHSLTIKKEEKEEEEIESESENMLENWNCLELEEILFEQNKQFS